MERFSKVININVPKGIPMNGGNGNNNNMGSEEDEEKRLELRLGPPPTTCHGAKRGFQYTLEATTGERNWLACCKPKVAELQYCQEEKKPCSNSANTDLSKISSHKRGGLPPVVGWPPVRSFRKNLGSSSLPKMASDSLTEEESGRESNKDEGGSSLYVKINMDGIPIGRKVDLKAYDNYEKLSSRVDELFRGLLAAQREENETRKTEEIRGLLDGNGEYTLVYEDSEGDRILVGDVPWSMFVASAKRLRVLKRSELPAFNRENR